jgi:L-rhamnose-H+ transport protein
MEIAIGLVLLLVAAFFQGSFVLPMKMTRNWNWENTWLTFSLFGMCILNLALAFFSVPNLVRVYQSVPGLDLLLLIFFGLCWGLGAVLFGIAMDRLGLALGYPIIMGLIASFGAVIPMLIFHSNEVITLKGSILIIGSIIVVFGITLCAKAHALKEKSSDNKTQKKSLDILIAVAAGILSCLPNIGLSFGKSLIDVALKQGASDFIAVNAVWALFFMAGFIPNAIYTICLLYKNKSFNQFKLSIGRNSLLGFLMAFMWIGSFYLYGGSTLKLGTWGSIIGWPLFISLSIIIGYLWGLAKSEWKGVSVQSKSKLNQGLLVIFSAVVIIAICNFL